MEQTILTAVSAVGFPIVVTFYLLTSFQKSMDKFTDKLGDTYGYLNLSGVNPELSDDDLLSIGKKLGNLQAFPVASIGRTDSCLLAQEH